MSYNYRTRTEQALVNIKITVKNTAQQVKEALYHFGLVEAPEVHIQKQTLPQLPAQISR